LNDWDLEIVVGKGGKREELEEVHFEDFDQ
jgi:hypothetical protein